MGVSILSYAGQVQFGLITDTALTPDPEEVFDILASRSTAVMTNLPGPTEPLKVAGSTIKQSLFWVPQSADLGMGVSILSYAGQVQFGLITDTALTPDPEAVVSRFPEEFEAYLYHVLLSLPPAAQVENSTPPRRPAAVIDQASAGDGHPESVTRVRASHAFSRATASRRKRLETRR